MTVMIPRLALISTLALGATGCQTTVGNYFANRARDLGEIVRLQVGVGPGLGVSVRAGGYLDLGLAFALVPRSLGIGTTYGKAYAFGYGEGGDLSEGEIDLTLLSIPLTIVGVTGLVPWVGNDGWLIPHHWRFELDAERSPPVPESVDHGCWSLMPGLLSLEGWDPFNRRAQIHAFDIEASVYAGIVYAKAGFSPGEFVAFLLGWFGADIAADDHSLGGIDGGELEGQD